MTTAQHDQVSGRVVAVVFASTLPMTVQQMTSAQNNLTTAFWLVGVAIYALQYFHTAYRAAQVGLGLCLGLAALTKSTVFLFAIPIILVYATGPFAHILRFYALAVMACLPASSLAGTIGCRGSLATAGDIGENVTPCF